MRACQGTSSTFCECKNSGGSSPVRCICFLGATKATTFEHICIIAEWLFENNIQDLFRLPKITVEQRQQQMIQANYSY